MGKGFLPGVLWGGVSGIAVMAVLSLYAPLSAERSLEVQTEDEAGEVQSSVTEPAKTTVASVAEILEPETPEETAIAAVTSEPEVAPKIAEAETAEVEEPVVAEAEPEPVVEPAPEVVEPVVIVEVVPDVKEELEMDASAVAPETPVDDGITVVDAPEPQEERPIGIVIFEPEDKAPEVQAEAPIAIAEIAENALAVPEVQKVVVIEAAPAATLDVAPASELADEIGQTPVDPAIDPAAPTGLAENDAEASDAPILTARADAGLATAPTPQPFNAPALGDAPVQEGITAPLIEITAASPSRSTLPSIEPEPEVEATPETDPAAEDPAAEADSGASSADQPITIGVPQTPRAVTGVVTGRLPSLGGGTSATPGTQSASPAAVQTGSDALRAHAANPIANAGASGLMSIILIDAGAAGMPIEQMTDLAFPFSVAIDPVAPDAASRAAVYRAAGIEVLALPADLPESASASDVTVAMDSYFDTLPEAVAVLDTLDGKLQSSRSLLNPVLGVLQGTGHGFVTFSKGLNSAQQAARRAEVEGASVFRVLDGKSENPAAIKRTLDRAGFNAAKDGSVVLLGHSYADTVTTLLEWSLDAKSASLSIVPVSQILIGQPSS
ncbi:MAG: divergent polysaccharide deacetylase family protein [Pseudomonadota bacterium]